jgi:hypothetical protein
MLTFLSMNKIYPPFCAKTTYIILQVFLLKKHIITGSCLLLKQHIIIHLTLLPKKVHINHTNFVSQY